MQENRAKSLRFRVTSKAELKIGREKEGGSQAPASKS
jgi:hypothetical protein